MNPFDLLYSSGIYKMAVLYFSSSRGLAIVGRGVEDNNVEVVQISGEVDPRTGDFVALDFGPRRPTTKPTILTKADFDNLLSFIASRVDEETVMSVVEPDLLRHLSSHSALQDPCPYVH